MPAVKKILIGGCETVVNQLNVRFKSTDAFRNHGREMDGLIEFTAHDGHSIKIFNVHELSATSESELGHNKYKTHIFAVAFDLSAENLKTEVIANIKRDISDITREHPNAKIVFIAANSAEPNATTSTQIKTIATDMEINHFFSVALNDPTQIESLIEYLHAVVPASQAIFRTIIDEMDEENLLRKSLEALQKTIMHLPEEVQQHIATETETMVSGLQGDDHASVITTFQHNCNELLIKHAPPTMASKALKAIAAVAIGAVVAVITAAIGFGIGFAAGLWTGPGAFISGFLAGTAAASAVVAASGTIGLGVGAFSAYHFFKPRPTLASDVAHSIVENVVTEANHAM